jgi:hypothetical protein
MICIFFFFPFHSIKMVQFKFQLFKFDGICQTVALTLCPLMGKFDGIEPICYSRNVEVANLLVFQPGKTTNIYAVCCVCN